MKTFLSLVVSLVLCAPALAQQATHQPDTRQTAAQSAQRATQPPGQAAPQQATQQATRPPADAIRQVVSAYLTELLGVPATSLKVETPKVNGDNAMTRAVFPGHSCDFSLVRSRASNEYGWIIDTQVCRKA